MASFTDMLGQIRVSAALCCGLILFASASMAHASVAIYVGKNLTSDGSVLLAGFGDEPSSHWLSIVPRRQFPAGATVTVGGTEKANLPGELIQIPQVRQTSRYLSMDYSYYAGFPAPLTNGGLNEHGVAVRDVALYSRAELVAMTPKPQRGVNYSDLARLALERARTAREALDIAIDLVERHGDFSYGGNSHMFADSNEGWVFLTFAGGKGLWIARRLGPDDIWLNWRGYTGFGYVQTLPADWRRNPDYRASANFVSFAEEQGWYRADKGVPFNVIEVYGRQNQYSDATAAEAQRVAAAVRQAAPKVDVLRLMTELQASGKDSAGYGQVAHLRNGVPVDLQTLWIAAGPPITAAFVPWRIGVQSAPPEYRRHRYLTAGEAERHTIEPSQRGLESTRYVNRSVKRLLYLVDEHRDAFLPEVSAALTAFNRNQIELQPGIERTARLLLDAREPDLARRYLTEQAHIAAAKQMDLLEGLAAGIEARTRVLHGIRTPDDMTF
jgi:dipeptidase